MIIKWIKITDRKEQRPREPFIATDGKRIAAWHCPQTYEAFLEGHMFFSSATHYMLLKDLTLPDDTNDLG